MPAAQDGQRLVQGDLLADIDRRQITLRGEPLALTPTEFELLVYLMQRAGKVLSHRDILQQIWGPEYGQELEYIRVYIGRLSQKIEDDPQRPRYLQTVRGIGYYFNP